MSKFEDRTAWRGHELRDSQGQKIGSIEEIYLDTETDQPEWALVKTGMLGTKQSFVPLQQARTENDAVHVPFEKAQVKDAPSVEPDGQLTQREEAALYRHYGLDYSEQRSDTGLPEGGANRGERDADWTDGDADRTEGHEARGAGFGGRGPDGDDVSGPRPTTR